MSYEIKVTDDQASFIEGYIMVTDLEREVYYIPYWFERMGDKVYAAHSLDALPNSIKELIRSQRGEIIEPKAESKIYTEEDMIEFAQIFIRGCQKYKVTPYQLEIFDKGKKRCQG